jgi:hypothetical protein
LINLNVLKIQAFDVDIESDKCNGLILNSGEKSLNSTFTEIFTEANNWEKGECENNIYRVNIEKGEYKMEENTIEKKYLYYSYYEPQTTYYGMNLVELKKSLEIVGEVDEETNEPLTIFECPGVGFMGFVDVIYKNRDIEFRNIKFTKCYNHWFKIFHFYSFNDDRQPEYRFENCVFENNYDESIFFYEYLAGDSLSGTVSNKYDGLMATSTKKINNTQN